MTDIPATDSDPVLDLSSDDTRIASKAITEKKPPRRGRCIYLTPSSTDSYRLPELLGWF